MKTGKRWSCWKTRAATLVLAMPMMLYAPGCAEDRASVGKNLMAAQSAVRIEGVAQHYRLGCPDVIELTIAEHPEFSGPHEVGPDGRIDLGDYGKLRVEGRTTPEIAQLIAQETGAIPDSVQVRVSEFRSQHVLLFGEVIGSQRSVPYLGQETVADLLQRVGGITHGAEPKDVYVVRPHLGDNRRPQVIHVDLHAIVLKHDHKTNTSLLPFDQVYVGETRQAQIEKAIPPFLQTMVQAVWDTRPAASTKAKAAD